MSSASRVALVTQPMKDQWVARLQNLAPDLHIERRLRATTADIPDDLWRDVEIIYTYNTLPMPEQAPRLRWVQLQSAGANHILNNPLLAHQVTFTTASGVHAVNIAEYVFTTILGWYHHFEQMIAWKQRGHWPSDKESGALFMPQELRGMTLGVVGYGSIGREVARLARTFGMRVLAMQRGSDHRDSGFLFPGIGDPEGTLPERYYRPDQLHEMLGECDVVVIGLPLTTHTEGLFDEAALRAMKKNAFLVNIARGNVCDEDALVRALREEWIAGAALDVFRQEPLPDDSPLYQLPNVIMSPHISGATPMYSERVLTIFEENLRRYLHGEPLYNVVERERGY
ncbi:MAG: D-2-hydroxyacid dehydrogenase [Ktedonobacteraceae bacterium]|nr:D-2-hydroxyacid dehydrogenase [Ktedonobacteraceae bacterium]